jgi:hypothetical protein
MGRCKSVGIDYPAGVDAVNGYLPSLSLDKIEDVDDVDSAYFAGKQFI